MPDKPEDGHHHPTLFAGGSTTTTTLSGVRVIAMDEFAIQKGHRHATVIVDPMIRKVLWVGRGRVDIRAFFESLGSAGRHRIKAVMMDMNGAYQAEVRHQCRKAEIVFDLFHVVAKFGRAVVKSARWLLREVTARTSRRMRTASAATNCSPPTRP